ncbi:MAG: HutD family protein, partial [Paenibacillus sp.]|uniref:HutD family protein n=1 Tax=Paenibacillus sp. TaxID=58172 RepID=UPI0028FF37EF
LAGFNRILMVLEGELALEHEGHHMSELKPFQQDHFKGEWRTTSKGLAVDFNLIFADNCDAVLDVLDIYPDQSTMLQGDGCRGKENGDLCRAIFAVNGELTIGVEGGAICELKQGDLFLMTIPEGCPASGLTVANPGMEPTRLLDAQFFIGG